MSKVPVTFLPSHPGEGWMSMNRFWDAMLQGASRYEGKDFQFECPLKYRGITTARSNRILLGIQKQIIYPAQVSKISKNGIAHILDHSYAFLLKHIPSSVKTVVTVHDLLPFREPENLSVSAIQRFRQRVEWIQKADILLSVSEATRQDLVEFLGIAADRIEVIPNGAPQDSELSEFFPLPQFLRQNYIFSIGGYMKRKNLEILPHILERVRKDFPDLKLIRAGAKLPVELVNEFHKRCGPDSLIECGTVSDDLLKIIYQNAKATIIPSRYEGFGLPIIEAMARGCPVLAANSSSLPEAGGTAALYFPVDDADKAADQLKTLLNAPPDLLEKIKYLGRNRAQQFTWENNFNRHLEIYQKLSSS